MTDFLSSLGNWNWFIAGGVLLILEAIVPGVFLFWLGLAAFLVGGIAMYLNLAWQTEFILFAVFSVAMIPAWRHLLRGGKSTDQPFLNRRADALVGRVFTLDKPIVDGVGTVRIDDSVWRISGDDTPTGRRIRVVRVNGTTLEVELVTPP